MSIHFLGHPPRDFVFPNGYEFTILKQETPSFVVDALLVFVEDNAASGRVKVLERSGRPVLHLCSSEGSANAPAAAPEKAPDLKVWLAGLSTMPRTNYQPIDCNFYDNFEAAIVQGRKVALEYRDADGETVAMHTRLKDLKTDRTEEYVQLANGEWIRLDRIVSVDGTAAGASCRF